jgi:Uma2 family endonuclease
MRRSDARPSTDDWRILIFSSDDGIVVEEEVGPQEEWGMATYRAARGRPRVRRDLMTVEEYFRTPETVRPQELIYGALRVADAPLPRHQRAVAGLFRALDDHVAHHLLGEVWLSPIDVVLDAERHMVVQPDLLFISNARSHIVTDRIRGAPDLVIEVLSPRPRIGQIAEHLGWFAEYGSDECWIIDLFARHVEVVTLANGIVAERRTFDERSRIRSNVLPGFSRNLGDILGF